MTEEEMARRVADSLCGGSGGRTGQLVDELRLCLDYENAIHAERQHRRRELPSDIDPHDLRRTGWGVIFAPQERGRAEYGLSRLLQYREDQAGDLFQVENYPKMRGRTFLWYKKGEAPGTIKPSALPYYLLLVGNPEQIPFEFQYELAVNRAVGRIYFDNPADYARYADAVVDAEERGVDLPKKVDLFSVEQGDTATDVLAHFLVEPLNRQLPQRVPDWPVELRRRPQDRKQDLEALMRGCGETPGLLLVACHGKRLAINDPKQEALQGALVCRDGFLHAGDLESLPPEGRPLHGLIAGLFACHSVGTPVEDSFPDPQKGITGGEPEVIADRDFLASLPRALLARGALAVLGHVDRGWTASFRWMYKDKQTEAARSLEDAIVQLLQGHRLGHALRPLYRRYSNIATHLMPVIEALIHGHELEKREFLRQWTACLDARNYLVLGDPAVYALGCRRADAPGPEPAAATEASIVDHAEPVYLHRDLARRARTEAKSRELDLNAWVHEVLEGWLGSEKQPADEKARALRVPERRRTDFQPIPVAADVAVDDPSRAEIVERLAGIGLVRRVDDLRAAELRIHRLQARGRPSAREPAAALGALKEPGWVVTDGTGELLGPFRSSTVPGSMEKTLETVLRRAQQRVLKWLALVCASDPDPLATLLLERRVEGMPRPAEPSWTGGEMCFQAGDELAFQIRNDSGRKLWTCVVDLGIGGVVERIPYPGSDSPIGSSGSAYADGLYLELPEEFPFYAPGERPAGARETLLLFASTVPVDLEPLFRGSGTPDTTGPLGRILAAILAEHAPPSAEDLRDPGWSAVARTFLLRG